MMDNLEIARRAVIEVYKIDGYYKESFFEDILNGIHDETFAVRVALKALEQV